MDFLSSFFKNGSLVAEIDTIEGPPPPPRRRRDKTARARWGGEVGADFPKVLCIESLVHSEVVEVGLQSYLSQRLLNRFPKKLNKKTIVSHV